MPVAGISLDNMTTMHITAISHMLKPFIKCSCADILSPTTLLCASSEGPDETALCAGSSGPSLIAYAKYKIFSFVC